MGGKKNAKKVARLVLADERRGDEVEADDKVATAQFSCFRT